MIRLDMKNYNMILTEVAKRTAFSSGKFDKNKYIAGERILRSNQRQIKEQATFAFSLLGRAFEKQIKK